MKALRKISGKPSILAGLALITGIIISVFPVIGHALASDYIATGVLEHSFTYGTMYHDYVMGTAYNPATDTYWNIDGGKTPSNVYEYLEDGTIVTSGTVPLDGRAIVYRPEDGNIYIASYGGGVYQLNLPFDGTVTLIHSAILQDRQCGIAFANGGNIFDVYNGTVREYDFASGGVVRTFSLSPTNYPSGTTHPYNTQIASDGADLYFLSEVDDIYVYDFNGVYQTTVDLNHPSFDSFNAPFSLSYANERIYIQDTSDHIVYGYRIKEVGTVPDIKANGSDGPLTIAPSDTLSLTVELAAGSNSGQNADWWVLGDTPFGWYRYNVPGDTWQPGMTVTHQGPLFDLSVFEVLNGSLPLGNYTFYFGVDTNMNGSIDMGQIYYDSVDVNISEYNPCNILFDDANASMWFGGDDRVARNVGVGQSIILQSNCYINSVGFKFSRYFDYSLNPEGHGHEVTLVLNVRTNDGTIINTVEKVLPAEFNGGWVAFDIEQNLADSEKYIFTCYLKDGEILEYNTVVLGNTEDMLPNSDGYAGGAQGLGIDMEDWNIWGTHPWDFNFQMNGTPTP
jgi:hypothetical protein